MTVDELKKVVLLHFVPGHIIFTDGKKPSGYYETSRISEESSQYATYYTKINIKPETDVIKIMAKDGSAYVQVAESPTANIILARNIGTGTETIKNIITNGVIHEIDRVLKFNELDTK
jgi:uncharacterized surface protein with fasciclin (FAS1) repeats